MSEEKETDGIEGRSPRKPSRTRAMLYGVALAALSGLVAVPVVFAASRPSSPAAEHLVVAGAARVTVEIPEVSCAGCSLEARKAVSVIANALRLRGAVT